MGNELSPSDPDFVPEAEDSEGTTAAAALVNEELIKQYMDWLRALRQDAFVRNRGRLPGYFLVDSRRRNLFLYFSNTNQPQCERVVSICAGVMGEMMARDVIGWGDGCVGVDVSDVSGGYSVTLDTDAYVVTAARIERALAVLEEILQWRS